MFILYVMSAYAEVVTKLTGFDTDAVEQAHKVSIEWDHSISNGDFIVVKLWFDNEEDLIAVDEVSYATGDNVYRDGDFWVLQTIVSSGT